MAALSWGIEAEMLGSLMMLASGRPVERTELGQGVTRGAALRPSRSGKAARIRPASEMSRDSTATPPCAANARRMGRNEYVASAGASSVWV